MASYRNYEVCVQYSASSQHDHLGGTKKKKVKKTKQNSKVNQNKKQKRQEKKKIKENLF